MTKSVITHPFTNFTGIALKREKPAQKGDKKHYSSEIGSQSRVQQPLNPRPFPPRKRGKREQNAIAMPTRFPLCHEVERGTGGEDLDYFAAVAAIVGAIVAGASISAMRSESFRFSFVIIAGVR